MADQALLDHWQQAFQSAPAMPPDITLKWGIAPALNPATDPLYLTLEESAERDRIRAAIARFHEDSLNYYVGAEHYLTFRGRTMTAPDVEKLLDREAYDLLVRRVNEREIAARCHMTLDEVQAVKDRHEIRY